MLRKLPAERRPTRAMYPIALKLHLPLLEHESKACLSRSCFTFDICQRDDARPIAHGEIYLSSVPNKCLLGIQIDYNILEIQKHAIKRVRRLEDGFFDGKQQATLQYSCRILLTLRQRSHHIDKLWRKLLIGLNVDAKRDVALRGRRIRNRNRGVVSKRSDETRSPQRSAG